MIEETFHKKYSKDVEIKLLSTEYVVDRVCDHGERTLNSIHADMLLQLGSRDLYHFECQIEKDRDMILRMLEYDMHIALVHGIRKNEIEDTVDIEVNLPKSVIIYLEYPETVRKEERYHIKFADGTTHIYQVPILKVQDYSPEMIEEKHLNMLIPFLPIRFRKFFNKRDKNGNRKGIPVKVQKELTALVSKCIIIVNREKENGTLTERAEKDILELLGKACDHLLQDEPEMLLEVRKIMEPAFKLMSEVVEELEEQIAEKNEQLTKKNKLYEDSIFNLIVNDKKRGRTREKTKEEISQIFSLNEQMAEERMKKYWDI
ncbi:MAG: hypothetical protein ACI4ED_01055 [Suilimivivens sp.]